MSEIPNLGMQNMLGVRGGDVTVCRLNISNQNGLVGTHIMQITTTADGQTIGEEYESGGGYVFRSQALVDRIVENYSSLNGGCPPTTFDTISNENFTITADQLSRDQQSSGIYEYLVLIAAIAVLAVTLSLLQRGIFVAKKAVGYVTEETNQEDNIEWYEGRNGQMYWRIKHKRHRS